MIDPGLAGRVALVTGANHGIGAATARALAAQGAAVLVTALPEVAPEDPDPAFPAAYAAQRARSPDHVVAAIRASGARAEAWAADLADPATVPALFDRAEALLGPVEILVHNANAEQIDTFDPARQDPLGRRLAPLTQDTYERSFAVGARATALLTAEFASRHVARGAGWGRIVCLTTGQSPGFAGEVTYGAAKNALESFTASAAEELGRYGVTANTVCPPVTDTGWLRPEALPAMREGSWLRHVGEPDEVAEVIVFLVSHQARFVTGQKVTMR